MTSPAALIASLFDPFGIQARREQQARERYNAHILAVQERHLRALERQAAALERLSKSE